MEIVQIAAFGMVGAILSVTLRKQSPEFALLIGIVTGVLIFIFVSGKIGEVIDLLRVLADGAGVHAGYLGIVLKVIGISYIAEFATELCMDAGERAIATKIQFAGKVLILVVASPVLLSLMQVVLGLGA